MNMPRRQRLPRLRLPSLRRLPWRRLRPRSRRSASLWALVLLVALWWWHGGGERRHWPRQQILDAIRFVESSGRQRPPDGDDGLAIGPYQIHRVYWQDALRFAPELGGDYQDCRRRDYAERVITIYMQHYVPAAWASGDAEVIARTHNGGPKGTENQKTDGYWQRVRAQLP